MKYLEKNSTYKDKKKNVGARVSEVVLSALNNAEQDSNDLGYTFSITRIIDKALQDTLVELVEETGMDYLAIEQFKFEMNERQEIRNIKSDDSNWIDFESKAHEIKLMALNDSSIDMKFLLEEEEKKTTDHWDKYVINRKEKIVKCELENLQNERDHAWALVNKFEIESGMNDAIDASNSGWGHFYTEAAIAAEEAQQAAFDRVMKKNEKAIQKILDGNDKRDRERQKKYLAKKYPEKNDAEIEKIIDTPMTDEEARQDLLDIE
jgi:hypothetical protein